MRIPCAKVYRAFSELDMLDDKSCRALVRTAMINHHVLVDVVPLVVTILVGVTWPVGWIVLHSLNQLPAWVPVPGAWTTALIALAITTVIVTSAAFFMTRDVCLWLGLRKELGRVNCPRCGQSMVGLPIRSMGDDNDPGKRYVRCTECGRRHMLLDLGLTPRDLLPYELRDVRHIGAFAQHTHSAETAYTDTGLH